MITFDVRSYWQCGEDVGEDFVLPSGNEVGNLGYMLFTYMSETFGSITQSVLIVIETPIGLLSIANERIEEVKKVWFGITISIAAIIPVTLGAQEG